MAAIDLLNSSQKGFVENQTLGVSESIVFKHADSALVENTFAFVGTIKLNKSKDDLLMTKTEFANVYLEEEPEANDIIECDGKVYTVDTDGWTKQNNLYKIIGSEKRHNGRGMRR